jgi:hypothetical protein
LEKLDLAVDVDLEVETVWSSLEHEEYDLKKTWALMSGGPSLTDSDCTFPLVEE